MTWDKPKDAPQWLALFAPAGICVLSTLVGALAQPKDGDWIGWAIGGLLLATLISFIQSIWLARVNVSIEAKIGCAALCFLLLMVVNCTVSFAGCAVGWSTLPAMTFH